MDSDLKIKVAVKKMGAHNQRSEKRIESIERSIEITIRTATEAAETMKILKVESVELVEVLETRKEIEQTLQEKEEVQKLYESLNDDFLVEEEEEQVEVGVNEERREARGELDGGYGGDGGKEKDVDMDDSKL